jgi:hypothetical protein
MTTNAMVSATRNLPTTMTGEVERLGYSILRGLDRLGFVHESRDGVTFAIRFDVVRLYGESWAAYHVDAERLYHFSVADLAKRDVLAQLSAVTHKPVRAVTDAGLTYAVELQPKPKAKLPTVAPLDLGQRPSGDLLVPLGIGRSGPRWVSLLKIGHAMIAGATGAGKSTFVHSALAALLTSCGPDKLRVALIDPKRHELTAWAGVPHLMGKIAVTPDEAAALLGDLCQEIDRRGDLFGAVLCRDIVAYNKQAADPLPFILCVCDEVLDLTDSKDTTEALKTIARRGRSAGVILWAATQHAASIAGMPRVVNVNLSSRFVFRVADRSAAEVAGCPGAETIPPTLPGRMLAKIDGAPEPMQGFCLSDGDLAKTTRTIAGSPATGPTLTETEKDLATWAIQQNGGYLSVPDVQQRAGVGYREALRMAQQWERAGWLEKDAKARNKRRVTELLGSLVGAEG